MICTAPTGHGATQAPQPVQALASMLGKQRCAAPGRKRTAVSGHGSAQARQWMPCASRQLGAIWATWRHGVAVAAVRRSARGWHATTQSPQKVHSPRWKSTSGKPPSPRTRIRAGQAGRQASQRVQSAWKRGDAHGGRTGRRRPPGSARSSWRRVSVEAILAGPVPWQSSQRTWVFCTLPADVILDGYQGLPDGGACRAATLHTL